jgi:hypothetical protein
VGIDTDESGTMDAPGDMKPGDRIPALKKYSRRAATTAGSVSVSTSVAAPGRSPTRARC